MIRNEINDDDILNKAMSVGVQDVYDCSYCGLIFPSQSSVNEHEENSHKSQVLYECTQCNFKTHSSIIIDKHLKNLHSYDKRCRVCSKRFNQDKKLIEHIKTDHLAFKENDLEILSEGPIFHHDEIITPALVNDYKWVQGSDFKCGYCRNRYIEKMDLIKHFESCTNVKIDNQFQCRLCSFTSNIKGRVDSHFYDTHKTNFFSCNDCNEKYKLLSDLLVHISEQHVEYSTFDCNYCVKKFVLKTSLDYHLSNFHEDQLDIVKYSKYQCSNCQAMFKTDSELLTHVKNNAACALDCNNCTVEKCDKKTSTDDCVEFNYERTHRSYENTHKTFDDDEDVYVIEEGDPIELFDCERCEQKFKTKENLDAHMSFHLNKVSTFFQCTLCQIYCKGKKAFKKHIESHSSELIEGI